MQELEALRKKKRDELRQIDNQANSEINLEIEKTQKRKMQKLESLEKQFEKVRTIDPRFCEKKGSGYSVGVRRQLILWVGVLR